MKNDDNVREHIRNVLIECRTQRNLTQAEVGKAVGKSKTAITSLINKIEIDGENVYIYWNFD